MPDIEINRNLPLVSIGIPTYNRPELLKKCLFCLLNQTYINIEIVVSDNCSPNQAVPNLVAELRKSHANIIYFRHSENIGPSNNFNFVRQKATGKYFMWLADDDLISDRFIEETVNFLEQNEDYSLASGIPFWMDGEIDKIVSLPILSLENCNKLKRIFNYILNVGENSIFYSLMRKTQIDSVLPLPTFPGSDWLLISRMLYLGKAKILPGANLFKNSNGISDGNNKSFAEQFNSRVFWTNHPALILYIHLLKDIFHRNYFGQKFTDKLKSLLYFSAAYFYRDTCKFFHTWGYWLFYVIIYQRYIKQYFFHLFYLLLPASAFNYLRGLKRQAVATFRQICKFK
ncbi:MAG: glycosyltransferase family 2 protein [Lentisphaerota bacterium]